MRTPRTASAGHAFHRRTATQVACVTGQGCVVALRFSSLDAADALLGFAAVRESRRRALPYDRLTPPTHSSSRHTLRWNHRTGQLLRMHEFGCRYGRTERKPPRMHRLQVSISSLAAIGPCQVLLSAYGTGSPLSHGMKAIRIDLMKWAGSIASDFRTSHGSVAAAWILRACAARNVRWSCGRRWGARSKFQSPGVAALCRLRDRSQSQLPGRPRPGGRLKGSVSAAWRRACERPDTAT